MNTWLKNNDISIARPSEELVRHVKDLYNERVSDVRFLIPVLTGLSRKEVVAVLPKLIKLNPQVVKEVLNFYIFTYNLHTMHIPFYCRCIGKAGLGQKISFLGDTE